MVRVILLYLFIFMRTASLIESNRIIRGALVAVPLWVDGVQGPTKGIISQAQHDIRLNYYFVSGPGSDFVFPLGFPCIDVVN